MHEQTAGVLRRVTAGALWLAVAGLLAWPAAATATEELSPPLVVGSAPSSTFGATGSTRPAIPQEFGSIAPVLDRVVGVIQSLVDTQTQLKGLRTEVDDLKTKLSAINSERSLVDKEHQQVSAQLQAAERAKDDRLLALRKELEAKLTAELNAARAQMAQEAQREFDQELQAFEARQDALVSKTLDSELALKERELAQLADEINMQTQELLDRLARLEANSELAKSLERSTSQALAKRRQELEARRAQLATERRDTLARQRNELIQKLTQQRNAEVQRRVTFKEASLRSAIAELLRRSALEEQDKVDRIRQSAEQVQQRRNKLVQQEALLRARTEEMDGQLSAKAKSRERLEADRRDALAQLEDTLAKTDQHAAHPVALAWLGRAIRYLPAPVASEIIPLQQRLVAAAEQEQRLREQRRIVREREQALQLSREMEKQHRKVQEQQQREQDVRSRNAEELLAKADRLAAKGQFDQALEFVAQAQAINPPQLERIAMVREQLVATKTQRERQEAAAGLEHLFQRAKIAFDAGRYEEAVVLFEQVIAQEATVGRSPGSTSRLMAESAATGAVR